MLTSLLLIRSSMNLLATHQAGGVLLAYLNFDHEMELREALLLRHPHNR